MNITIKNHFKKNDPILHAWMLKVGTLEIFTLLPTDKYFEKLCDTIVGQQLSGRAADTIFGRFKTLFKNGDINPEELLKIPHEKLRAAGLSNVKATYVKNLAQFAQLPQSPLLTLSALSDEEVITELTKVKGIGRWTAEMFLMFSLGRPNVFSHGDLGLRNAMKKIYGFKREPSKKRIESIVKKWSPYRTFASRILWKCLEIKTC